MIKLGYRPLIWNIMKYYAHFGHKDFILCLGYKGDSIKRYFVEYKEYTSNNFILNNRSGKVTLLNSDLDDWNITFVDTGMTANIGQRLVKVEPYLEGEEEFLANYTDGLTDLPLNVMIDDFRSRDKIASFLAYQPNQSFHVVQMRSNGDVRAISPISKAGMWINAGYFAFKKDIFNYIREGEELVEQPFQRLIEIEQLYGYRYDGFWTAMDTFKDKQRLDDLYASGKMPWGVWKKYDVNGKEAAEVC
jgi:glucose-1-phosphate cytidylyltransferase